LKQVGFSRLENELAVRKLVDAGELHFHDRAEQGRQRGAEIAPEAFVEGLQSPHLLLADPLGALEVVEGHLVAGLDRARAGLDRRRLAGAGQSGPLRRADLRIGRHGIEQAFHFRLAEHVSAHRSIL